jgi:hypothetical protein
LGSCLGGFPRKRLNYPKSLNLNPVVEGYNPFFYLLTQPANPANQSNQLDSSWGRERGTIVGRSRADNTNQSAEQIARASQESYEAVADAAVEIQERNIQFSQSFVDTWNETLRRQAETTRAMTQVLVEQTQRQQEAFRTLTEESASTYIDLLYSMFPYPQEKERAPVKGATE